MRVVSKKTVMDNSLNHLTIFIFILLFTCSCGNRNIKSVEGVSIDEPEAPQLVTPVQNWDGIEPDLQIGWGSSNTRYHREYIPEIKTCDTITYEGWKNERISAQAIMWSKEEVKNITVEAKDLKSVSGSISAKNIKHYYVRNVLADEFLGGCGYKTKSKETAHLLADCLEELEAFNLRERSTRGIWFSIDIPADAEAGVYSGEITISLDGKAYKTLDIKFIVKDRLLPEPANWTYHLDLWQNPFAVARVHNVDLWSDKHFELMLPLYKLLAEAGQKCITATIVDSPWGGQSFDPYGSMVESQLKANGEWSFDYTVFDRWVNFMMELGINKQINCYSMIPWGNRLTYYDEKLGCDTFLVAPATSQAFADYWIPFLNDFKGHLKDKKWFNKTTIAMDERPNKDMKRAIELVNEHAGLKVTSAANYDPGLSDKVYDLSVASRHILPEAILEQRRNEGQITTYYVCCSAEYPNNFTFSPPVEGVWQAWYAYSCNLDGFLRWAYNSWVEQPLTDTRFRTWPAGDTFFVYPGAKTSIRFEKLREGIQDFEKLRIITNQLKKEGTPETASKLAVIDQLLKEFTTESITEGKALTTVLKGKDFINSL